MVQLVLIYNYEKIILILLLSFQILIVYQSLSCAERRITLKERNQSFLVPFNLLEKQLKTGFSIVMDYSSSCSDVSSDGLNVDTSNNLNDIPFDDNEGSDMDFDEGDAGSVILISGDAQDYFEGDVEELASVSSLLDSESDNEEESYDVSDDEDIIFDLFEQEKI